MLPKSFLLIVIKHIPISSLKNELLRRLFKYEIGQNVKIGKSVINCNFVKIGDNVYIADRNVFSCEGITIGNNTSIHSGNSFRGNSNFTIGKDSRIINNHHFDLWNDINIGDRTWIAGISSQFWTHGSLDTKLNNKDLSINIGNDVYIGSSVKFSPGVKIKSLNLIGLGSVVSGPFLESETVILGNPAKVVKRDVDWRINW